MTIDTTVLDEDTDSIAAARPEILKMAQEINERDAENYSDTYTPTPVARSNVDSCSASTCMYTRSGDVVTVAGTIAVNPTATGVTTIGIPLPIASDFTTTSDAAGTAVAYTTNDEVKGAIFADATNNTLTLRYVATVATGDANLKFVAMYQIK